MKVKEIPYIYVLRVVGSVSVVAIHAVGNMKPSGIYTNDWLVQNGLTAFLIWAVPVFVMMSGMLFLQSSRTESFIEFYRKRILRIGIPTVFWVSFYYLFMHLSQGTPMTPINIVKTIFLGPYDHLYFLIIILELYVLTPFFRLLVRQIDRKTLFLVICLFLFIGVFWKLSRFSVTIFIPYIGYYLLGHYLESTNLTKKQLVRSLLLFLIACLVLLLSNMLAGMYTFSSYYLYYHANPLVMLLSISFFLLGKSEIIFEKIVSYIPLSSLKHISTASLGIYIIHPFILLISIHMLGMYPLIQTYPWYISLLFIPYLYIVSYGVTRVVQWMPFGNYLLG